MREGYKKTDIGIIPEDWEVGSFKDIIKLRKESFNPLIENNEKYIGLEHIEEKTGRLLGIGESEETSSTKNKFYKGDILFGKLRPYLRKYYIADFNGVCVTEILPLVSINSNNKFCFYKIQEDKFIEYINNITFGTKMPRTSWNDIKDYKLAIPPLKEQEKIAEILSTVDSQIDDTEKLIEKCKELKKGLMQKLLTKGIDHSEFKKTEVGEIPVEWEVKPISDVSSTMSGGTPNRSKKHYYINGNISWVKTGELGDKYIYDTEEKITDLAINESSAKLFPPYSVIIAMYGATIGKSSININEVTTNQACCSIICDKDILSYEYLYYYLDFNKDKLIALGAGGAQPNISQQIIRDFKITVPNVNEQEIIIQILSAIDNKVEKEQNKKQKLEELKKGLMQQLLTGKIRTV